MQTEQLRQQNLTGGLKAGHCLENFGLKSSDVRISSSEKPDKEITSIGNWHQNANLGHDSDDYMQSSSYLHQGHDCVPMQSTGGSMMTEIESETKSSSQVHSMESCSQPSYTGNQNPSGMFLQASGNDLAQSKNQVHMIGTKIECPGDLEGTKEGASGDVQDGSSLSTELDEISLEATTFRQLQQVMRQVILLCINC